jgi:type I restriction enzyme, R subunit
MSSAPVLTQAERLVQDEVVQVLVDLGWKPCPPAEMNARRQGRLGEAVVEPLLVDALQQINDLSRAEAEHVASLVRRTATDREFLKAVREGLNIKLSPDQPARDIWLVDLANLDNNSFVVTWEFPLRTGGAREPRLDVVCLVSGLPLGLIENKAEDHDVMEAAQDWARYYDDAPQLEALGAVVACNNGIRYRVGPSGLRAIQHYAEWKDTWPHVSSDPTDEMTVGLTGTLHPHTLIDLAANFIVFETRDGVTTKKLARYQQFRAANKIVDRVVAGQLDRGLIWHTTGSGKSLTMVLAARKLMHAGLDRPTVFIVIDRTDLDDQLSGTFGAVDCDGLRRAETGERLRSMIASDKRGVIVTIVNKFRSVQDAVAERENVIVFVDEAHRSHEGEFGIWMRAALPHARLFAFTGTPVETGERSTRRAFSPVVEQRPEGFEVYEQYLDVYSIRQSIEDGATVAVLYEPRLSEWQLEDVDLDAVFDREFSHLSDEQREALRKDAAREAVVAKAPRRVNAITEDVVNVLHDKVAPNGFKAQLVAVDRDACVGYAEALADHLEPNEYAVIISRDSKKDDDRLRSWWPKAALHRVRGEPVTHEPASEELSKTAAGHKEAVRQLIERFTNPEDPLKLLIVNAMLLTGFDAPVEQAMFLDRPLRRHTLLQAIARTNRTFPGKQHGLVFDYWGVLNDLNAALAEFDPDEVAQAATNTDALAAQFPAAIARALNYVANIPSGLNERRRMRWLVGHFAENPDAAAHCEEAFRSAVGIYETLAPDPRLAPHVHDYRRLVRLRAVWKHGSRQASFDVGPHRAKTHGLVHDAISDATLQRDLPVYRIDGDYLKRLNEDQLTPEEKAAEIDAAAVAETRSRGEHDPVARSLAERLRGLRERHARSNQMTLELLAEYEQAVEDYVEETEGAAASGLSERAHLLSVLSRAHAQAVDETTLNEVAERIDTRLRDVADFHGWQDRADVLQAVRKVMISELAHNADTRALATSGYVDEAIAALVAAAG